LFPALDVQSSRAGFLLELMGERITFAKIKAGDSRSFPREDHQFVPEDAMPVRFSTSRKKLVRRVRYSTDLNNVANNQFAASSGFHLTVDLNFTALDQQFRLSAGICNATKF
jgi:hypothetical protein